MGGLPTNMLPASSVHDHMLRADSLTAIQREDFGFGLHVLFLLRAKSTTPVAP